MQFPLFEHLKKILVSFQKRTTGKKETDKLTLLETGSVTAVSAGSAGAFAAVITTPVDVVKTRIMLSAGDEEGTVTEKRKSSLAVAREVVAKDGPRGLMRGAVLRGLWTAMGSGLYLGVYESGRVLLEDRRDDREGRAIV
jgi:solute carrier family 25 S-adenosylmethionine transporter 26